MFLILDEVLLVVHKTLLSTFFFCRGIYCYDGVLSPQTENGVFYDTDIYPVHHDCDPLPGFILDQ